MMKGLKTRPLGFRLGVAAAMIQLLASVVLLILDGNDRTFSWITIALNAAGILCFAVMLFREWQILPLAGAVCFGAAWSWHLYLGLPTLSDIWNGVHFIGGNAWAVYVFGGIFTLTMILAVLSCFGRQSNAVVIVK